ncbi:MAG TPA: hypothetical protein VFN60_03300 [Acidimicrobiales bacterium]|nr:hypothetical protein [Acidimicrobiales bacterium]
MPRYRFTRPDADAEELDVDSDEAADAVARDRSRATGAPVTVHRHSSHVDAWEYVTEVDERA